MSKKKKRCEGEEFFFKLSLVTGVYGYRKFGASFACDSDLGLRENLLEEVADMIKTMRCPSSLRDFVNAFVVNGTEDEDTELFGLLANIQDICDKQQNIRECLRVTVDLDQLLSGMEEGDSKDSQRECLKRDIESVGWTWTEQAKPSKNLEKT